MSYKVNKEKCIGCGLCVADCPGGTEMDKDGKAKVIDQTSWRSAAEKECVPMEPWKRKGENRGVDN